jgi:hypothetical protein
MFVIGEFRKFKEDVGEENQGKVRKLAGEKDMAKTLRHKELKKERNSIFEREKKN